MNQANYVQCICGECLRETGESKTAIYVTVKTGSIRIDAWLCRDCMAKAEDAQEAPTMIRYGSD